MSYNVLQFLKAITAKVNKQNKGGMVQRSGHEGSAVISCMTSALMLESGSEEIKPCPVQPVWGSLEREKEFGDVWGCLGVCTLAAGTRPWETKALPGTMSETTCGSS